MSAVSVQRKVSGLGDQSQLRRPYTPLHPNITFLARGNLSSEIRDIVQRHWKPDALPSVNSLLLTDRGKDCNAYFVSWENRNVAVVKIRQEERSSPRHRAVSDNIPWARDRRCGVFHEILVGLFMERNLQLLEGLSSLCVIPQVAYAQMGHPAFSVKLKNAREDPAPSLRGTGTVHQFIQNLVPFSALFTTSNQVSPLALEYLAVMDLIIINQDRHLGNMGIQQREGSLSALVLYDHSDCFPSKGMGGGFFGWRNFDVLHNPPSAQILQFVEGIKETDIEDLAKELLREISENVGHLSEERQRDEIPVFGMDRILPHKIALCFTKTALKKGWSLSQIAGAVRMKNIDSKGVITSLYEKLENHPEDSLKEKMEEVCLTEIEKPSSEDLQKENLREETFSLDSGEGSSNRDPLQLSAAQNPLGIPQNSRPTSFDNGQQGSVLQGNLFSPSSRSNSPEETPPQPNSSSKATLCGCCSVM